MTRYAGPAMLAGTYAMFSFEVTCEPMDVEISFRKGADESRNDARRSDGDAAAAAYVDEDDEARFILHRGALEHPEMLGVYANDSLSFGLFPHEDSLNIDVDAIDVGVWYLQIVVISGSLRSGFEISHRLFGSRLARFSDFNGCEFDDGTLSVTVRSENETYTRREPFVAEPDYGACGNDTNSCYLGEQHSGDAFQGRGAERTGTGPVSGRAVVAMSTPVAFDDEYFLLAGDARKFLGNFSTGWFTTDGFLNATLTSEPWLLAQMVPNRTSAPFDHEACGTMLNAADLRGAVCVTSRGGCFFSQKTLACQKAGAVAAVIIDTEFEPLAAVNWVGSHPPDSISIPTIVMNLLDGNKLLKKMYDEPDVRVGAEVYECRPKTRCRRCAPGFASPGTNCSTRCPGLDDAFSSNCSRAGECVYDEIAMSFSCVCEDGFSGDACDILANVVDDRGFKRADRSTIAAVLAVTFCFVGVVVVCAVYQIRRRRRRMTGHIIWKPHEEDESGAPPTAPVAQP